MMPEEIQHQEDDARCKDLLATDIKPSFGEYLREKLLKTQSLGPIHSISGCFRILEGQCLKRFDLRLCPL